MAVEAVGVEVGALLQDEDAAAQRQRVVEVVDAQVVEARPGPVMHASDQLDQLLAEVAALEQAEEGLGRGLQALRHGLAVLELAGGHQRCPVPSAPAARAPCAR